MSHEIPENQIPNHFDPIHPAEVKADSGFRLWNLIQLIFVMGLWFALVRRHMDEPTLQFRFRSGAPLSVSTRLFLGHLMTSLGLVFGLSQIAGIAWRQGPKRVSFGRFGWAITGFFLMIHLLASLAWSGIHQFFRNSQPAGSGLISVTERVVLLTSHQGCFDEFAWLLVAFWAAAWLVNQARTPGAENAIMAPMPLERSDMTFACYTSLVVLATIFQRVLEAGGG
ncbi:MAG: hypothetical protein ACKO0V_13105 [bacterium]